MPGMTDIHAQPGSAVLGITMAQALPRWLTSAQGDPMITYVDGGTGERTELSRATVANWSAKAANLLDVEGVDHVTLRTNGHWASVPSAIGAWRLGVAVFPEEAAPAGHRGLTVAHEDHAAANDLAVGPGLGGRLSVGAPPCRSFVDEVLSEPDDVLADAPPAEAVAMLGIRGRPDEADLSVAVATLIPAPDRWLLIDPVDTAPGLVAVAAAVAFGVSLVVTRRGAGGAMQRLAETEKVRAAAASPRSAGQRADLGGDLPAVDLPPW